MKVSVIHNLIYHTSGKVSQDNQNQIAEAEVGKSSRATTLHWDIHGGTREQQTKKRTADTKVLLKQSHEKRINADILEITGSNPSLAYQTRLEVPSRPKQHSIQCMGSCSKDSQVCLANMICPASDMVKATWVVPRNEHAE